MKLIVCNTYSQLIIAIQLKVSLFENETVDLWMSDHSNNAEKIIEPLKKEHLFNEVIFLKDKQFVYERSKINIFLDVLEYSFGKKKTWNIEKYDEIIFYSLSLMLYSIADYYEQIEHKIAWSRMEEGLFSYETDFESGGRIKFIRFLRRLTGRIELAVKIEKYYCFFPELKISHLEWNLVKIPSINETINLIVPVLRRIFGCNFRFSDYKHIYFASSSDIDGLPFGETELVLKIGQIVGMDNLIVKMHPRDERTVYANAGIRVMENSWIPWEVVQLIGNYDKCILLTVNSGAFITVSALKGGNGIGMFLYPEIEDKSLAFLKRERDIETMLNQLHKNRLCTQIQACSIDMIKEISGE